MNVKNKTSGNLSSCPTINNVNLKCALVFGDIHIPYQDSHVIESILYPIIKAGKFTDIVIAGDLLDCYCLSRFNKDPARIDTLQQEINQAIDMLGHIAKLAPAANKILIKGNHEERLGKQLRETQIFNGLNALEWPNLLTLSALGWKWKDAGCSLNKQFLIQHGCLIRKHSGYTARGMYEKYGVSGMSGHSHRMGCHCKRDYRGEAGWWENGHLCDISKIDYIEDKHGGVADWQQGFSQIFYDSKRFFVNTIHIKDGLCVFNGKLYGNG